MMRKIESLPSQITRSPEQNTVHQGSKEAAPSCPGQRREVSHARAGTTRLARSPCPAENPRGPSRKPSEGHQQQVMALQHKRSQEGNEWCEKDAAAQSRGRGGEGTVSGSGGAPAPGQRSPGRWRQNHVGLNEGRRQSWCRQTIRKKKRTGSCLRK